MEQQRYSAVMHWHVSTITRALCMSYGGKELPGIRFREVPFRQAWAFHHEVAENVFCQDEGSDAWRGVWSSRRFESGEP